MNALKSGVTLLMAVVLIVAGGVLIGFLFWNIGVEETTWQRYTFLLSGVEAVVFAAVGWLFGKEVHREQAATAEQERKAADTGKQEAVANAAAADAKGLELARAIIAAAGGPERAQTLAGGVGEDHMAQLVRHARISFPDA